MKIDTSCPHERDKRKPTNASYSDYKPLGIEKLKLLLTVAAGADWKLQAKIQVRLTQAIPGMTCPRPTSGPVAKKMVTLDRLYVDMLRSNPKELPGLVADFWRIVRSDAA